MIQNEYQYKITKSKLDGFLQTLSKLESDQATMPPVLAAATQNSFQTEIDKLSMELKEYEELKAGQVKIAIRAIDDLPNALIKKRIKLGMTQKELAEKVGIKEQMIQRYESSQYGAASFQRVSEIAQALALEIPEIILV
jgi:HTH-type transcriptional regulator / antitoxin HipB